MEKLTTVLSYIALGAFAAYLGFWWDGDGAQTHLLPVVSSLGLIATGLAIWSRRRKIRGNEPSIEIPMPAQVHPKREPSGPRSSPATPKDERHGEAALLGHEMKNYLCTLKGNASLLRQRIKGNDRTIIDRIDRVVEKLESFTKDMTGAPTANRQLRPLRLADTAKACAAAHFHANAEGFEWKILDAGCTVGDGDRLEQVFLNLYANAFEAGATRVSTSLRRLGDRLRVRVEDNGKGCAAEDVGRIFEPFFTTKPGPARRGLGMFIVQSIVENHGGRITAETKNGTAAGSHGLAFTLDFPLAAFLAPEKPEPLFMPDEVVSSAERWLLALPEPI